MAFVDGYEKVSPGGTPPKSAPGTEKSASGTGPGPKWAKGQEGAAASTSSSGKY